MKKPGPPRTLAVLFAACIVLSLLPLGFFFSKAADEEMLMIAGYEVIPPVKSQMPFESGGVLYVPVLLFARQNVTVTVTQAGVTLATLTHMVFFDTRQDVAYDENGTQYAAKAVYRNGHWFVPVPFTAERLDLYYSRNSQLEPVGFVRISRKDILVSDETIVRAWPIFIERYWNEYISTRTSVTTASSKPPATSVTQPPASTPITTPGSTPPPATTTPEPKNYRVYLAFEGLSDAETVLARLQTENVLAAFAVTPADIAENPGLIRQVAAAGHSFLLLAATAEEAIEASDMLFSLCKRHVSAVLPTESLTAEARQAFEAAGFALWESPFALDGDVSTQDMSLLQNYLNRHTSGAFVLIRPGAYLRSVLYSVFRLLAQESSEIFPILPIDRPVLP